MTQRLRTRAKKEPDVQRYGAVGSPIPGSAFVRGYCPCCGEAIRITADQAEVIIRRPPAAELMPDCAECQAALHPGHGGPSGCYGDDESLGGWSNNVRAMEGD